MTQFHVIDGQHRRRAQIARELLSRGLRTEIYENFPEFLQNGKAAGVLLANNQDTLQLSDKKHLGELGLPVVVYSERPSTWEVVDAIAAGAVDFMDWPFDKTMVDRLLERLASVNERKASDVAFRAKARASVEKLSQRETEVLALVVDGGSNKSIGLDLGISSRTVEIHRGNLMRKLEARSTAEAVRLWIFSGVRDA